MSDWYIFMSSDERGKKMVHPTVEALNRFTEMFFEDSPEGKLLSGLPVVAKKSMMLAIKYFFCFVLFDEKLDTRKERRVENSITMMREVEDSDSPEIDLAADFLRQLMVPMRAIEGYAGSIEIDLFREWIEKDGIISPAERRIAIWLLITCLYGEFYTNEIVERIKGFIKAPEIMSFSDRMAAITGSDRFEIDGKTACRISPYSICGHNLFKEIGADSSAELLSVIAGYIEESGAGCTSINFIPVDTFLKEGTRAEQKARAKALSDTINGSPDGITIEFVMLGTVLNVFANSDMSHKLTGWAEKEDRKE